MDVQRILDTKGSTEVFAIGPEVRVSALVKQLCEKGVGALLITNDDGSLAGIVSERDVIRQIGAGVDLDTVTAGEIMTRDVVSVKPEDDINAAMDLMVAKKIRHLPVVSEKGPHGLVTVRDLMHAMREADRNDIQKLVEYLQSELPESTAGDQA